MNKTLKQTYTQERLKLVLDSTRLGMWDWNPQTDEVVFDRNWAEMLGLTLEDLSMTLEDWSSRVHPDDLDKAMQDIQAHINGDTDFYENLHRMRHADGHWVYILDRGRVVEFDADGKAVRFTGTHADLTPLKQAEFDASLAIKSSERFFSAMSHELRAPIHAMLGIVEQVQKQLDQPDLSQKLSVVQDSGQHLLLLINDVLDAAKFRYAAPEVNSSVFDVRELIQHVVRLFDGRAREKGITLQYANVISDEVLYIATDRSRLSQILINLVSNAIKFTDQGRVKITLELLQDALRIVVADTGRGINDVDQIFQPFFSKEITERLDDVHSTGLGLSITRELIEVLGMTLAVQSVPGQGSTFTVSIPASFIRARPITEDLPADAAPVAFERWPEKQVLLVDDTPINLMLAEMMLEDTPLVVRTAASVDEAITILQQHAIDLILTDLHMPERGGLQLTEAVRAMTLALQPPVIVTSADSRGDVWEHCLRAGANDYLEKPFDAEQMLALVHRYVVQAAG